MAFEIGSMVQLKSGGPALTVVAVGDAIMVAWYSEGEDAFKRDTFPAAALDELEFDEDEEEEGDE